MSSDSTTISISSINPQPKKSKIINETKNKWSYLYILVKEYVKTHISAIKIQSLWRGYHLRMELISSNDNYTFEILIRCLDKYITDLQFNNEINSLMSKKKRRNEIFPSDISENIVKFVIASKYRIMPCWDTDKGDIVINKKQIFKQIEVKGFMSNGPSSFGPKENWDLLYFVDGQDIINKNFTPLEI